SVCAGLVQRFRTGRGQHLDVSLLASSLSLLPDPTAIYFDTGLEPGREGNRNPAIAPGGANKTHDGYMNIVLLNEAQWKRFCQALGERELATEPRFATNAERISRYDEFQAYVEARLVKATTATCRALREGAGRSGPSLRVPRGVRGPAGQAPGPRRSHGAAGPRNRARPALPDTLVRRARAYPRARPAARPAHGRSPARAELRRGPSHAPGRPGRHP